MAIKKSKLRIQLARIKPRPQAASTPAKTNHMKPKVGAEIAAPAKEFSVGRILRSCLASVDAMLPEVEDHRADIETEMPDFNVKFKGCLAAVGATIDADPGTDFDVSNDISKVESDVEDEKSPTTVEEESDEAPAVVKRKPGRPKKSVPGANQSENSKTPEPQVEQPAAQEPTEVKQPQEPHQKPARTLRDRSAKSDVVEDTPQSAVTPKAEEESSGATAELKKKPGRPKKNSVKPDSVASADETPNREGEQSQVPDDAADSEDKQEAKTESSGVPEVKARGRGRKKVTQVEEPPPSKLEDAPAGPRRGRKRGRTDSEATPDAIPAVDETSKARSPQQKKRDESPQKADAETKNGEATEPVEASKKKRGRFRRGKSPKEDEEVVESTEATATPEAAGPVKETPVTAVAAVIRKSLRSAEDSDSADTVIEETDKVRGRRGRPPSTDESRSAKQNQKVVSLRGRGKKTVLKVALPIRARSTRGQADKSGENQSTEGAAKFSLPAPPPPALSASRSPSPKISSPRGSVRTVRVTAKKKPQRNSHASDTDTAEETLDQEEFLRQKEKLESSNPIQTTSTASTSHQVCTIPVHAESTKPLPSSPITTTARLDEPVGKKQKTTTVGNTTDDGAESVKAASSNAPSVLIVGGKRERKRKVMSEFADPNAVLELAPTATSTPKSQSVVVVSQAKPNLVFSTSGVTTSAQSTPSTVTVKPMVTIVSPSMANKQNISLISSSQPGCSYLQSGLKPIVITVPSPSSRQASGTTLPGVTKTIVLPKVLTRPIAQSIQQQKQSVTGASQQTQLHHQAQIRSIRLSPSMTSTAAQRSTTAIVSRPPPQRVLPSPIRTSGVQTPTSGSVVIRTIGPGSLNAPRLITSGGIRPSIIRAPRIVTTMPGGVRPRLMSTFTSPSGARIVTVRPSISGATMQTIRTTVPGQPNKVFVRTVAPIIPQRHITVQATPSQPVVRTVTEPTGSRPVSAAMVIRSPPRIVVKPSEATAAAATKQTSTTKRVAQQIVRPVERKAAPQPAKKAAVQPRKVVNVAKVAPETVQPTSSVMEKLLEEPQLPKVGKKPLSKKQRSMRKTDLIKTSTRSRRRGEFESYPDSALRFFRNE